MFSMGHAALEGSRGLPLKRARTTKVEETDKQEVIEIEPEDTQAVVAGTSREAETTGDLDDTFELTEEEPVITQVASSRPR